MGTKATYNGGGGNLAFYQSSTHERFPIAPLVFYDDFLGTAVLSDGTVMWSVVEVALNLAIDPLADTANGVMQLTMDADNNAEDAVLYWGDQKGISLKHGAVFECRARVAVAPTLTGQIVFGMAGDHHLDKDSVTESAWFKFDGGLAALAETDDTTNDNDDVATGVTVAVGEYRVYRIDFTNLSDVKFYINGVGVATGTTFDMSNLSDSEAVMQPYFSIDKGADTGVGTLWLDYVRIWSNRAE